MVFHEEPVSVATPSATLFSVPRLNPGVVKCPGFIVSLRIWKKRYYILEKTSNRSKVEKATVIFG